MRSEIAATGSARLNGIASLGMFGRRNGELGLKFVKSRNDRRAAVAPRRPARAAHSISYQTAEPLFWYTAVVSVALGGGALYSPVPRNVAPT